MTSPLVRASSLPWPPPRGSTRSRSHRWPRRSTSMRSNASLPPRRHCECRSRRGGIELSYVTATYLSPRTRRGRRFRRTDDDRYRVEARASRATVIRRRNREGFSTAIPRGTRLVCRVPSIVTSGWRESAHPGSPVPTVRRHGEYTDSTSQPSERPAVTRTRRNVDRIPWAGLHVGNSSTGAARNARRVSVIPDADRPDHATVRPGGVVLGDARPTSDCWSGRRKSPGGLGLHAEARAPQRPTGVGQYQYIDLQRREHRLSRPTRTTVFDGPRRRPSGPGDECGPPAIR